MERVVGSQTVRLLVYTGLNSGPGSLVGIVAHYGLDGPGIEWRRGQDFTHPSITALGPTQPPKQRVMGHSGEQSGVALTTHSI